MRQRVDPDRTLAPVPMPAKVVHEICQHAVNEEPWECCGLVVGSSQARYMQAVRCTNIMNKKNQEDPAAYPRDGRSAFFMDPQEYGRALQAAESAGLSITAVYHSHVGAGPYLSEMDLAYAEHAGFPFPEADQIVVSVYDRVVRDVALFRRTGKGFVGHRVEPVDR